MQKAAQVERHSILWLSAWVLLCWNTIYKTMYLPLHIYCGDYTTSGRMEREALTHSLKNIICPMWNPVVKVSSVAGNLEWNKFSGPRQWNSSSGASVPSTSLVPSTWAPGEPCYGNLRRCYLLFPSVGRMHWTVNHAQTATTPVTASQPSPETKKKKTKTRFEQTRQIF